MNYPAAELRGIKMNFYLINPDAEHRGILLIKKPQHIKFVFSGKSADLLPELIPTIKPVS
jgi:hypothetical protein